MQVPHPRNRKNKHIPKGKINLMGMEMTPLIISRIEKGTRHVVDAELKILAKALGVTMDWLCGEGNDLE